MNGMANTRKYLDLNFAIEKTKYSLSDLKLDIITQEKQKSQINKMVNYLHLNSIFLYYLLYIVIGITTIISL